MSSLRNRTRPSNYKSWLTDIDQPISTSTLRSRAAAEQRRREEQAQLPCEDDGLDHGNASHVGEDEMGTSSETTGDSGPQLLPDGDDYIYSGSPVKKNDLLLLFMAFVLRYKLPAAACQALLTLFDLILPGCIPATNYFIEKVLGFDTQTVQLHYFCPNGNCMNYFGTVIPEKCCLCDRVLNGNSDLCDSMFVLPLVEQLKHILSKDVNWNHIFCANRQQSVGMYSDVVDGKVYKKLRGQADITLQFNCDGAPIFHSSRFSIWPLVCCINELPTAVRNCNLMLHTLWFGRVKPCASTFLKPFVSEINRLYFDGFAFTKSLTDYILYVSATLCICDAPARAMLQEFSQFNGHYGCGFCYNPGKRMKKGSGTVQTYPINNLFPTRSHKETLELADQATAIGKPVKGVKGASLLALLPNFDIVKSFVPDYMHCVLLGVVRQFVNLWTDSSSHGKSFYVANTQVLDNLLKSVKPPDEIHRLPRTLSDRKFWKASEFLFFLLLYSPVILSGVLPKRYYVHWLLLVNGIRLLLLDVVTDVMLATSRNCLHKFVTLVPELYGADHVSYNVHILCHLPDAVRNWGPLWSQSAFVYEDVIGVLKKMYHGTQLIPKQVFKYFSAWNKLQYYSILLIDSDHSVITMYKKFCSSNRSVLNAFSIDNFVGLRKSPATRASDLQNAMIKRFLQLDDNANLKLQSYFRFIINKKVFSVADYAQRWRRNNSFVMLSNGCFADIICCFAVSSCTCTSFDCQCCKSTVLLASCYTSTRAAPRMDRYVGTDLTNFVRKLRNDDKQLIAVAPDDIVCKCMYINDGFDSYALHLPHFDMY